MSPYPRDRIKKIRNIQIYTSKLADEMIAGAWHSAFKGKGIEFEEVREYQIGDEIRNIDWNVFARTGHPYIKVFKEERELTVFLIVDISASSLFGSTHAIKQELIAEIGAILAFSAIKNSDKIGLLLFSSKVEKYIIPKKGVRHVLRVIRELLAYSPAFKKTDFKAVLEFLGTVQKKRAICFFISDFLCPIPSDLMNLIAKRHDLIAIHVSDPYELEFPNLSLVQLEDLETGAVISVDSSQFYLRENFKNKQEKQHKELAILMHKIKAGLITIKTDEPYFPPLYQFFKQRKKTS